MWRANLARRWRGSHCRALFTTYFVLLCLTELSHNHPKLAVGVLCRPGRDANAARAEPLQVRWTPEQYTSIAERTHSLWQELAVEQQLSQPLFGSIRAIYWSRLISFHRGLCQKQSEVEELLLLQHNNVYLLCVASCHQSWQLIDRSSFTILPSIQLCQSTSFVLQFDCSNNL